MAKFWKNGIPDRVFVCSDIHGQYDLYQKALKDINLNEKDHLFILGDVTDRGPDGIRILQDIMERKNVTCLLGNHEHMMYNHLQYGNMPHWKSPNNGGDKTYEKYIELGPNERKKILDFIRNMPLQVELEYKGKTFLFSHSDFINKRKTVFWKHASVSDVECCVWNSPWRFWEYTPLETYKTDGREHIIGHYPTIFIGAANWHGDFSPEEYKKEDLRNVPSVYLDTENHVCNIDCGCAAIGNEDFIQSSIALCVVDLEKYAAEDYEHAFLYVQNENSD